jgi:D-serine deaminase-like pyridoxal phosphate-dependent protein
MTRSLPSVAAPTLPADLAELLPTPCLVVDVGAAERNIARAADYYTHVHAKLRPHFKAHKCTELLTRQVARGSCVGVTCATAAEAEILATRGFEDILVANQIVDRPARAALGRAARCGDVTVAIDHVDHVSLLVAQAREDRVGFGVLIEVDVGMDRCGLAPGSDLLLRLADVVQTHEELRMKGIQGYEGHATHCPTRAERRGHVQRAAETLAKERERLLSAGYPCPIISGGGTGTFDLAAEAGVLDEVQAGSYALMDGQYGALDLPFENALFMLTTLISHRRPGAATINSGLKALSAEFGMPLILDANLQALKLADEHALLAVAQGATPRIGDRVFLVPAHIDPTINLHDVLFAWDEAAWTLDTWAVDGRRANGRAWERPQHA